MASTSQQPGNRPDGNPGLEMYASPGSLVEEGTPRVEATEPKELPPFLDWSLGLVVICIFVLCPMLLQNPRTPVMLSCLMALVGYSLLWSFSHSGRGGRISNRG